MWTSGELIQLCLVDLGLKSGYFDNYMLEACVDLIARLGGKFHPQHLAVFTSIENIS